MFVYTVNQLMDDGETNIRVERVESLMRSLQRNIIIKAGEANRSIV